MSGKGPAPDSRPASRARREPPISEYDVALTQGVVLEASAAVGAPFRGASAPVTERATRYPVVIPERAEPSLAPARIRELHGALARHRLLGRLLWRSLEVLPGLIALAVITSPFWAGAFLPLPLAIAVLTFDAYWLYLSVSNAYRSFVGARRMQSAMRTDFHRQYRAAAVFGQVHLRWEDVRHVIIIPNYKEPIGILRRTLDSIVAQEVARQCIVVLAMEERDPAAREKAELLLREYRGRMGDIFATFHPAGLPGEIAGKSSNEAWAAREAHRRLCMNGLYDVRRLTVTSCDADTVFHPKYFSALTYKFVTDLHRYRRFWQSPILLYNNIWQVPAPLRVPSSLSGLHILSNLVKRDRMVFPQSTYSLSFRMAVDVGFWDTDVVPEDWHMFLKCFYAFRGDVEVEPIFLPTGNDAVNTGRFVGTLKGAYQQHVRHAWGASDIPYALVQSVLHPEIPRWKRFRRAMALTGNHITWATHWFILSLGWFIPDVIAHLFGVGASPTWLPATARVLLTACLLPYAVMIYTNRRLRPPRAQRWTWWYRLYDAVHWALLPVTSLLMSTLPALEAQFRLAIGKRLEYRVTPKT